LAIADVDGDGHPDVLRSDYGIIFCCVIGGRITLYSNSDGRGSLVEQRELPTQSEQGPVAIRTADVDGDNDLDIFVANSGQSGTSVTLYINRLIGDVNDDGIFNSSDLVSVFQAGKYEDGIDGNATYDEGDWNQDGDFDSSDLVLAFQAGHFETAARPLESQMAAAIDLVFGDDSDAKTLRAFVA
jgi:hypothetical protein